MFLFCTFSSWESVISCQGNVVVGHVKVAGWALTVLLELPVQSYAIESVLKNIKPLTNYGQVLYVFGPVELMNFYKRNICLIYTATYNHFWAIFLYQTILVVFIAHFQKNKLMLVLEYSTKLGEDQRRRRKRRSWPSLSIP